MTIMKTLDEQLIDATRKGYHQKLKKIIKQGGDVNVTASNISDISYTAIMIAAEQGQLQCLEVLIKSGGNVNTVTDNAWKLSALTLASKANNLQCVKMLLDNNAVIDTLDYVERTALSDACYNLKEEKLPLIQLLIQYGANINHKDKYTKTPLMLAMLNYKKNDFLPAVKLLTQQGADILVRDCDNKTALDYAKQNSLTRSITLLESLEQALSEKQTLLACLSEENQVEPHLLIF